MDDYKEACELISEQLGQDVQISLATCIDNKASVRVVDAYYKDEYVYIVTYAATSKMNEIAKNPYVAFCRGLCCAWGLGENIGSPLAPHNKVLREELRQVFSSFYSKHVDETDPLTCILKIKLTKMVAFSATKKYLVDFEKKTAESFPFVNTIEYA